MPPLTNIDYIIALKPQNLPLLSPYLTTLRSTGLQLETREGIGINKHFVLIDMPEEVMQHYSNVYRVDRLPGGRDQKASGFLSSQRLLVLDKILETSRFGEEHGDVGITRLIGVGTVNAAYPLHHEGREVLWEHVSGSNFFRPDLPLDAIHAYFGAEIAFYFAYLSYASSMLVPVAAIGSFVFFASILIGWTLNVYTTNEVCDEHAMFLCPICHYQDEKCSFRPLSSYCFEATWTHVLDNYWTVVFAMFVAFWTTLFVKMWTLKENTLKFRWQVEFPEIEVDDRPEYVHPNRPSGSGSWIPRKLHLSTQMSSCVCLVAVLLAGYISIELYKVLAHTIALGRFSSSVTSALIQVIFQRLVDPFYGKFAILLTDLENIRTQANYNKSALYKRFMLSFANNYGFLFYIAFIKGRLYTPNDEDVIIFKHDSCQPTTCIVELSISLCLLLLLKRLLWNVARYSYMSLRLYYKTRTKIKQNILRLLGRTRHEQIPEEDPGRPEAPSTLPSYEEEYLLKPATSNFMVIDFCENVIDFGLVTFFVAVTPLAPLLVLLNNLLEIRIGAYELVARLRRPVPRRTVGIGEWNGVLLGLTYLSTATNAFVMAFTGDSTCRELYAIRHGSLQGYINSTLSQFSTKDNPKFKKFANYQEVCYYRAQRFPPNHPMEYERTPLYWENLAYRFVFVFVFEHVIFFSNAILAYLMPKMMRSVKEQKYYNKLTLRRAQVEEFRDESKIEVQGLVDW